MTDAAGAPTTGTSRSSAPGIVGCRLFRVAVEPEIRELADQLNRDAGFELIDVGRLEVARKM